MDEERGTQREIARTYRDRVQSRFTRTVWRSARFLLSVVLFAGGVVAIYYCEKKKPQEFFNTGPLSRSHAHLQDGCASCHVPERLTRSSLGAPTRFPLNPKMVNLRQVTLQLPRPTDGYTKTFASFSEGHPLFQLQRENVRDNNVLRF